MGFFFLHPPDALDVLTVTRLSNPFFLCPVKPQSVFMAGFTKLMPGFSNVRYRFYSDIDRLTAVLALHERKIADPFDKCLLT